METVWKILNWNIRGMNDKAKWLALANTIEEMGCDIICLQDTKKELIDSALIRKYYPKKIKKIDFLPSIDVSGGILVARNDSLFQGVKIFQNEFVISINLVHFCS